MPQEPADDELTPSHRRLRQLFRDLLDQAEPKPTLRRIAERMFTEFGWPKLPGTGYLSEVLRGVGKRPSPEYAHTLALALGADRETADRAAELADRMRAEQPARTGSRGVDPGDRLSRFLDRRRSLVPAIQPAAWIAAYGLVLFLLAPLTPMILPSELSAEINRFERMPLLVSEMRPLAYLPWGIAGALAVSWCFALSRRGTGWVVALTAGAIIFWTPMTFTALHALIGGCAAVGLIWRRGVRWRFVAVLPPLLVLVGGVQLVDGHWREGAPTINTWIGRALAGRMLDGLERDNVTIAGGSRISVLYLGTAEEDRVMHTLRHFPPELVLITGGVRQPCRFESGFAQRRPYDLVPFVPATAPPCGASHWVR